MGSMALEARATAGNQGSVAAKADERLRKLRRVMSVRIGIAALA
jgi:hypothetical protein